jgi:hypothetical protein
MNSRLAIIALSCGLVAISSSRAAGQVNKADRDFWSFRRLGTVTTPPVADASWRQTPIDDFILAKIELRGLMPAPSALRRTLISRATLDLCGLRPTPQQIEAFVHDDSQIAWERVIDRLLASPHYGERWARHWLDVVRFAESYGFEHDLDNEHAYHYRDFVIRALNDDMPFDQFVRWQLAGDELAPEQPLARMATAFLAIGVRNADIAKVRVEQERYDELDDIASTIGTSMLALSIGCARCHEHKYDPISQENYYQFIATFERTVRGEINLALRHGEVPTKVLVASEGITPLPRIYNPPPAFFETTWFLERGNARLKDHEVTPGFLDVLTSLDTYAKRERDGEKGNKGAPTYRRAALANWISDHDHGAGALLARVIVNRLWQHHFGRGIVTTPNDFGQRGARPSHPELLEWLAVELIRNGWRLKPLHRSILLSSAWQQATLAAPRTKVDDALFRGHRVRRLEAESIRDQMLAISGTWNSRMLGPGTLAKDQHRRSIYFRVKRSQQIPLMALFDAPDGLQSIGERPQTTVAPQALTLMNANHIQALAASFARRLTKEGSSRSNVVRAGYREALGRSPTAKELARSMDFIVHQERHYETPLRIITSPVASEAIVFWLDATRLGMDSRRVPEWVSRHPDESPLSFSAFTNDAPRLVLASTPQQTASVRFGPMRTILRADDHPSLNFGTSDFTVSLLFRINESSDGDDQILGKDSFRGGNSYTGYFFQHMRGHLRFSTRNLVADKGPVNYLDSTASVHKGRWHRATGVRRDGTLHLYLDSSSGPNVSRREVSPTNIDNTVGFKIGDMDEHDSGSLEGNIAEVLVYNRGLSDNEVHDLHEYLVRKHLGNAGTPLDYAIRDFCQVLFCLNEFVYIE